MSVSDQPMLINMPQASRSALEAALRRVAGGLAVIAFISLIVILKRSGYTDSSDGHVSALDAVYYATVSVTTTGYGDITPVSNSARLVAILVVTPARILFLVMLVGTTMEVLTDQSRQAFAVRRWRKRVSDHYIICGFGSTGKSVMRALRAKGVPKDHFVIIDPDPDIVAAATADGIVSVRGDASLTPTLRAAEIERASAVVVTPNRDDTAALVTLTARELRPDITIVAGGRDEDNLHLLEQSGANAVIHSADTVGRLLGLATTSQPVALTLNDMLLPGGGLDVGEVSPVQDDAGQWGAPKSDIVIAVLRNGESMKQSEALPLTQSDRLIVLRDHR